MTAMCLALVLVLTACTPSTSRGQDDPTPAPAPPAGQGEPTDDPSGPALPKGPIGELVATWSQEDQEWVTQVDAPVLLTSQWHLDHWLQGVPDDVHDRDLLTSVDFSSSVLVIGSYPRCTEASAIYVEPSGTTGSIARFAVESSDDGTVCAWSPVSLDAWLVPQDQTGDQAPIALSTAAAPGQGVDIDQVGTLLHSWQQGEVTSADMAQVMSRYAGLISQGPQRDDFVHDVAEELGFAGSALEEIVDLDLDGNSLVLTSYWQCTESSKVIADTSRDPVLVWVEISGNQEVDCDWSPYTIDVWQVPHTQVGQPMEFGQYLPFAIA